MPLCVYLCYTPGCNTKMDRWMPTAEEGAAARWECPRCGASFARGAVLRCSLCSEPARLASGDEILLRRVEMEVA